MANILLPHELVHSVSSAASGWGQPLTYRGLGCDDGPHTLATQQASWHVLRTIAEEETVSALSGLCTIGLTSYQPKQVTELSPASKSGQNISSWGRALQTYWVEQVDTGRVKNCGTRNTINLPQCLSTTRSHVHSLGDDFSSLG